MNLPSRVLAVGPHGTALPIAQTEEELRERMVKPCEAIGNGWIALDIPWGMLVGIVAALLVTFTFSH